MKVSIIIPSFNRADLIGETLDSIIAQSYTNWECLIIDDGSTDNSQQVYDEYKNRDVRFLFLNRPSAKIKGANACRNIGLENATGDYVVFFDSDDLMTPNHLEVKINGIHEHNTDYIITRTKFFNADLDYINRYYQFDKFQLTPYNYVAQKINWLTYDICIKAELAKSITFNENLQSGQEYNYFSKLVHRSVCGKFLDETVTLRRYHENSIRSQIEKKNILTQSYFNANWYTYKDLRLIAENRSLRVLMDRCVELVYKSKKVLLEDKIGFINEVFRMYKIKGIYFLMMLISLKFFSKGYWFKVQLMR